MSVPVRQTAFIYHPGTFILEQQEVPVPTPRPGHVLIKIAAAGVCHSDIHLLDGSVPYPDGIVLGHEIAGYIAAHGPGVDEAAYPARTKLYAVHGANPCGVCRRCRQGADNLCVAPTRAHIGLGAPGGYQEYTEVCTRNLTAVPDGVSPEVAAVATDAVLTPYHALKRAGISGLSRVLVIGLGGLGINGVQIIKALGAHVTAVDPKASSRALAKTAGADVVHEALPDDGESLEVDVVADFVGKQATFDLAQKHVRSSGKILPIGLGSTRLYFDLIFLALREIEVIGNFWGTSEEQVEAFELIKKGLVTPQIDTTSYLNVNQVMKDLQAGKVKSRMVLVHD